MSLSVQPMFQAKCYEFNQQQKSERFQNDFVRAFNMAAGQLDREYEPSSAIGTIAATDATVTNLEQADDFILSAGVTFYLLQFGVGVERMDKQEARNNWINALAAYDAKLRADETDDDEDDVAGLGYLAGH